MLNTSHPIKARKSRSKFPREGHAIKLARKLFKLWRQGDERVKIRVDGKLISMNGKKREKYSRAIQDGRSLGSL